VVAKIQIQNWSLLLIRTFCYVPVVSVVAVQFGLNQGRANWPASPFFVESYDQSLFNKVRDCPPVFNTQQRHIAILHACRSAPQNNDVVTRHEDDKIYYCRISAVLANRENCAPRASWCAYVKRVRAKTNDERPNCVSESAASFFICALHRLLVPFAPLL
jgi:hypothetical protein